MKRSYWWLAGLLAMSTTAWAQEWQEGRTPQDVAEQVAQAEAYHGYTARLATDLASQGGARELAFAAILRGLAERPQDPAPPGDAAPRPVTRDPQAKAWLRAAAAQAGSDVIANQLLITAAKTGDEDQRAQAAGRWQAADPGNLVPLMYMGLSPDELLVQARSAQRADARMYEGVRWMITAYRAHPPMAEEQRVLGGASFDVDEFAALQSMGVWAATVAPGYLPLWQACQEHALRTAPARVADCRHVAVLLASPDASAADQGIGLALLRELADSDAERADVEARQRRMHWQMLQWGRAAQQQPRDGAAQFVRLLADPSIRSEQQMVERVLQEAGIPPEPPAGWAPPRY